MCAHVRVGAGVCAHVRAHACATGRDGQGGRTQRSSALGKGAGLATWKVRGHERKQGRPVSRIL